MPNRYTRDELVKIAMDQAQIAAVEAHDAPDGVVQDDAYTVQWLQDIIDFWYHWCPFSATVEADYSFTISANTTTVKLPTDFILDVRNGVIIQTTDSDNSKKRMIRTPLQKWMNRNLQWQNTTAQYPIFYMVQGYNEADNTQNLRIAPASNTDRNAWLWYYKLPSKLTSTSKPRFPNDYVMIEYVKIRILEWARVYEVGTAQTFCDKILAGMKSAGLMNEPEDDEIPFDNFLYTKEPTLVNTYAWMGPR